MKAKLLLFGILFITFFAIKAQGQNGFLDTTFNKTASIKGRWAKDYGTSEMASAIAIDNSGRFIVASCTTNANKNIYVTRLFSNGDTDSTFGSINTGTATFTHPTIPQGIYSMVIQSDGKIVLGGFRGNIPNDMLLMRLNPNGTIDNSFNGIGEVVIDYGGDEQINDIKLQSDGSIIAVGTANSKIVAVRVKSNGTVDNSFAGTGKFLSTGPTAERGSGVGIYKDSILIGGDYNNASYYNYTFIKLDPNGNLVKRTDLPAGSSTTSYALLVQPDGKVIIGGGPTFKSVRLHMDGTYDNTYGSNGIASYGAGGTLKSLAMMNDGKIIAVGEVYCAPYCISVMRLDQSGMPDTSFATNGLLIIPSSSSRHTNNECAITSDQKLIIAGEDSYDSELLKVNLQPVLHIKGNTFVLPGSIEEYTVQVPSTWSGYTYSWSYTGKYRFFYPGNAGSTVSLVFSDTSTSGKLICIASAGSPVAKVEIDIVVNQTPSNANQLADVQCTPGVSDCSNSYIDYFNLNAISTSSTNCSNNGYFDYTQSDRVDTLAAGGVYSITLNVIGSGKLTTDITRYVAVWIDYNNDGIFNNSDEFVGQTYSDNPVVKLNNLIFRNEEGYDGPKRLRVRTRFDKAFLNSESCPTNGENGETEDYLVVILKQPTLEAPQIITPNEDGKNDYFVIRGVDPTKKNQLTIFDRWGAAKFSSANYKNDWNGTNKEGDKIIQGTYYYVFTVDDETIRGFLEVRY